MLRLLPYRLITLVLGLGFIVAGCADQASAPITGPQLDIVVNSSTDTSASITVTPTGGSFQIGKHKVTLPANSICDPVTSGYGPEYWDKPCTPLASNITFQVTSRLVDGKRVLTFYPDVRFVPTSDPARYVTLTMYSDGLKGASDLSKFNILFRHGSTAVDEGANDSTQKTSHNKSEGLAWRRIKHFCGYEISG